MTQVSQAQWDAYKNIINNNAHDSFFNEILEWQRYVETFETFNEDKSSAPVLVNLRCLMNFNTFRTWPVNKFDEVGVIDKNNIAVLFNRAYLSGLGYLTADGYFNFDPVRDRFRHRGVIYEPAGDVLSSQASDDPLIIQILLAREETPTTTNHFSQ